VIDVYGEEFFAGIDGVTNALDNVKARMYIIYHFGGQI
jgi:ubiquitin-activating enzyme E1